ncbi:MAG: DUF4369 domain-containing protein [Bacteroidales bacterium]|nr:DUF4369 domain-containing protein [Bacteroidales bacterium]
MNRLIFFFVGLITILSCGRDKSNFNIKGTVNGPSPETIYLSELSENGVVLRDSTEVDRKGRFQFKGYTPLPSFYL